MTSLYVVRDASSFAKRISWLKIEPWSRFSPVQVANKVATCTLTTAGSLCVLAFIYEDASKNMTSL